MNADQSTVVTSMIVTGVSVYLGALARKKTVNVKPAVGMALTGAVLLTVAGSSKGHIAAQFAVLIATTALLTTGYSGVTGIAHYLAPSSKGSTA